MTKFNCECVNQGFMQNKPWDKCDKCNGTGVKGSAKPNFPPKEDFKVTDPKTNSRMNAVIQPSNRWDSGITFTEKELELIETANKACFVLPDCMEFVPMEQFPEITAKRMHLVCTKHSESMRIFDRYLHKRTCTGSQQMVFHLVSKCDPLTSLRGCVGDVVFTFTPDEKLLNMAKTVTMGRHKIYRLEDNYHLCKADL